MSTHIKPTCQSTSQGMLSSIVPPSEEPEHVGIPPLSLEEAPPDDLPKSRRRVFCLERRRSLLALDSLLLFCWRFSSFFAASLSWYGQDAIQTG